MATLSRIFFGSIPVLFGLLSTGTNAQDGSGAAPRTPQSAHMFLQQVLPQTILNADFKLLSGRACFKGKYCEHHYTIGSKSKWPLTISSYLMEDICVSRLGTAGINDTRFQMIPSSNVLSKTLISTQTPDGFLKISVRENEPQNSFSEHSHMADEKEYAINWREVAKVSVSEVTWYGTMQSTFDVEIVSKAGRSYALSFNTTDLANRVASAAEYLKTSCDLTDRTGF